MITATLTIKGEKGEIFTIEQAYDSPSVMHNFNDIENLTELFKNEILPKFQSELLKHAQTSYSGEKNTAQRFHGAYPHWLNGTTGAVIPFSTKDNGADLVETSYLIQGLLCARQYFRRFPRAQ